MTKEPWIERFQNTNPLKPSSMASKPYTVQIRIHRILKIHARTKSRGHLSPYVHQAESIEAWARARLRGQHGTGSGKTGVFSTLCSATFMRLRLDKRTLLDGGEPDKIRGMKAIVLYPMNALVGDQQSECAPFLAIMNLLKTSPWKPCIKASMVNLANKNRFFQFGSTPAHSILRAVCLQDSPGEEEPKVLRAVRPQRMLGSSPNWRIIRKQADAGPKGLSENDGEGTDSCKGVPKTTDDGDDWSLKDFLNENAKDGLIRARRQGIVDAARNAQRRSNYLMTGGQRINDNSNGAAHRMC